MPANAVIETNCLIGGQDQAVFQALARGLRGLVQQVKAHEQLTVEAAVSGDKNAVYLALLNHPLVRNRPGQGAA